MIELLEHLLIEDEFDDLFKPATEDEWLERHGISRNPDGTYTYGKYTFDPNIKPRFPIVQSRASTGMHSARSKVIKVATLDAIPRRAPSFSKVQAALEQEGFETVEVTRLVNIPPSEYFINHGYQLVGRLPREDGKDWWYIIETAVGGISASAGYSVWVGNEDMIQQASREHAMHFSSARLALFHVLALTKYPHWNIAYSKRKHKPHESKVFEDSSEEDFEDVLEPVSDDEAIDRWQDLLVKATHFDIDELFRTIISSLSSKQLEVALMDMTPLTMREIISRIERNFDQLLSLPYRKNFIQKLIDIKRRVE
jgi:hypothetical protein